MLFLLTQNFIEKLKIALYLFNYLHYISNFINECSQRRSSKEKSPGGMIIFFNLSLDGDRIF